MRFSTLSDWLHWLELHHPVEIDLGLERVGRVATAMSLDLSQPPVVTIAGTNGKGSCVASLNALLRSAGYHVGCFTSPHFLHYNERVVINDQSVTDQVLMQAFDRIDKARGDISLTYFEFGTLAAIDIFQHSQLDVVILEVGLGGRLDAVNIIDADIAVVTSIDIDHQQWLGSDRELIGREKAGIYRPGKPAISAGHFPPASLRQAAIECGAHFYQAGESFQGRMEATGERWVWNGLLSNGKTVELEQLPPPNLPAESVAAALQALHLLGLPLDKIDYNCLGKLSLTGRFQQLQIGAKQIVLDVAHNPAAANYLAQQLQSNACEGRRLGLLALMSDKDVEGIIMPMLNYIDGWFIPELQNCARALPAAQLATTMQSMGVKAVTVCETVPVALEAALASMHTEDQLIVFGSFITVAETLKAQLTN